MKTKDILLAAFLLILAITGLYIHCKLPASAMAAMESAVKDSRETVQLRS